MFSVFNKFNSSRKSVGKIISLQAMTQNWNELRIKKMLNWKSACTAWCVPLWILLKGLVIREYIITIKQKEGEMFS